MGPELVKATIPVSEVFGPVWQGEGPHTGRLVHFLRLGHCNLHCSWCDTPYTWDRTRYDVDAECPDRDADWIVAHLATAQRIVLSGGEPMIHHRNPALLSALARLSGAELHAETNGTIYPGAELLNRLTHVSISPKVAPQGDPEKRRLPALGIESWALQSRKPTRGPSIAWKFVASNPGDVELIHRFVTRHDLPPDDVWVMPEGVHPGRLLATARLIAPTVAQHGMNLTLRQHVLLHGNTRGT